MKTVLKHRAALPAAAPAIDVDAPPGTYRIDALAEGLFAGLQEAPIVVARRVVRSAAFQAFHEAHRLLGAAEAIKTAELIDGKLLEILDRCAAIERAARDDGQDAFEAKEFEHDDDDGYATDFARICAGKEMVADVAAFRARVEAFRAAYGPAGRPYVGKTRALEVAFVRLIKAAYSANTGKPAPRSKSGPVVELAKAGWRDAGFEERDDIDDALASRMDK